MGPAEVAAILFGIFAVLIILRVPVAFALGLACVPVFFIDDRLTPFLLLNEMLKSYNSFLLLAIPFFMLAANLMNTAGMTWGWFQGGFRPSSVLQDGTAVCDSKHTNAANKAVRDYTAHRGVLPRRLLFGLAAVMLVLRHPDIQDTHTEKVLDAWELVDCHSPDSVLAFVQDVLTKQMEWSHEEIDLRAVAPCVAGFLAEIENRGVRPVMDSHFGRSVVPRSDRILCE